ncbi:hypothetical protein AOLI_G00013460 [Acnodon oligacanthus]
MRNRCGAAACETLAAWWHAMRPAPLAPDRRSTDSLQAFLATALPHCPSLLKPGQLQHRPRSQQTSGSAASSWLTCLRFSFRPLWIFWVAFPSSVLKINAALSEQPDLDLWTRIQYVIPLLAYPRTRNPQVERRCFSR